MRVSKITKGGTLLRKNYLLLLSVLVSIVLTACSAEKTSTEKVEVSKKAQQSFLLYEETDIREDGLSIGDLYVKTNDTDAEKISSGVIDGRYQYDVTNDKILFIDDENSLYEAEIGKEKVKLASDVEYFEINDENDEAITYQNIDFDLYYLGKDRESKKIASTTYNYEVVGKEIYYIDNEGDYKQYNIETRKEATIANDVNEFVLFGENETAYVNNDYMLFYKKLDEESVKISGDEVQTQYIEKVGDQLVYLAKQDETYNLYRNSLDGSDKNKIANDVSFFKIDGKDIYYLTKENNLYVKKINDEDATRIASDVNDFTVSNNYVYYIDQDFVSYFNQKGTDKVEKIASDIQDYFYMSSGEFLYLNLDDELFFGDIKLASDVEGFVVADNQIIYATSEDKLYKVLAADEEPELLMDELDSYSNLTYLNKYIYYNHLDFEDIVGYYYSVLDDGENFYIQFDGDQKMKNPINGYEYQLEYTKSGYHVGDVTIDGSYGTVRKDGDTLTLEGDFTSRPMILTKTTKEEIEQYQSKLEAEAAAESARLAKEKEAEEAAEVKFEAISLMEGYLHGYMSAVNSGDISYMTPYLLESSAFYTSQSDYAMSLYNKGTEVELISYNVRNTEKQSMTKYKVEVEETFNIYNVDGSTDYLTYLAHYDVENVDGVLYISDLEIEWL